MQWLETTFNVLKIVVWMALIFRWLALRLFRTKEGKKKAQSLWFISAIKMAFVGLLFVHGLSLLGILDTASLVMSFVMLGAGSYWYRDRQAMQQRLRGYTVALNRWIYGLLEKGVDFPAKLRQLQQVLRQSFSARVQQLRRNAWQSAEVLVLLGASLFALLHRLPAILNYPFPENEREFAHIRALKHLGANAFVESGIYPLGTHALTSMLRATTLLDEMQIWKLMGVACAVVMPLLVFRALTHMTPKRGDGAALLGALVVTLAMGSAFMGVGAPSTEFHPWTLSALLLLMGLSAQSCLNQDASPRTRLSLVAMSTAALGILHPLAWIAGMAANIAMGMARIVWASTDKERSSFRELGHLLLALGVGSLLPLLLLLSAMLSKTSAFTGAAWTVELFTDHALDMPWGDVWLQWQGTAHAKPPALWATKAMPSIAPLFVAAGIAAILILFSLRPGRSSAKHHFAAAYVGVWTLDSLGRLGLAPIFYAEGLRMLLTPLATVVCATLWSDGIALLRQRTPIFISVGSRRLHLSRLCSLMGIVGVIALACYFPPRFARALQQPEPTDVLSAYLRVRDNFVGGSWTVVAHPKLLNHTLGYGWHISRANFLESYRVDSYVWDPREPERTIPSPHTLIFVEHPRMPLPAMSAQEATQRRRENKQMQEWCARFQRTHKGMSLFYQDHHVSVFHIERSRDEERRILSRIWHEEHDNP